MADVEICIDLVDDELSFKFADPGDDLLSRFRGQAASFSYGHLQRDAALIFSYADGLDILRELGPLQRTWGFRYIFADEDSANRVKAFVKRLETSRASPPAPIELGAIQSILAERGFTKRVLKDHQLRDLGRLVAMPHGANFSVPGAGKTTVTLALNTVTMNLGTRMLVVAPKSAFTAWESVVEECMVDNSLPFVRLAEDRVEVTRRLKTGYPRLVINYEMMVQVAGDIRRYLSAVESHLVMDESHRIKAGVNSQRGATALAFG